MDKRVSADKLVMLSQYSACDQISPSELSLPLPQWLLWDQPTMVSQMWIQDKKRPLLLYFATETTPRSSKEILTYMFVNFSARSFLRFHNSPG